MSRKVLNSSQGNWSRIPVLKENQIKSCITDTRCERKMQLQVCTRDSFNSLMFFGIEHQRSSLELSIYSVRETNQGTNYRYLM